MYIELGTLLFFLMFAAILLIKHYSDAKRRAIVAESISSKLDECRVKLTEAEDELNCIWHDLSSIENVYDPDYTMPDSGEVIDPKVIGLEAINRILGASFDDTKTDEFHRAIERATASLTFKEKALNTRIKSLKRDLVLCEARSDVVRRMSLH